MTEASKSTILPATVSPDDAEQMDRVSESSWERVGNKRRPDTELSDDRPPSRKSSRTSIDSSVWSKDEKRKNVCCHFSHDLLVLASNQHWPSAHIVDLVLSLHNLLQLSSGQLSVLVGKTKVGRIDVLQELSKRGLAFTAEELLSILWNSTKGHDKSRQHFDLLDSDNQPRPFEHFQSTVMQAAWGSLLSPLDSAMVLQFVEERCDISVEDLAHFKKLFEQAVLGQSTTQPARARSFSSEQLITPPLSLASFSGPREPVFPSIPSEAGLGQHAQPTGDLLSSPVEVADSEPAQAAKKKRTKRTIATPEVRTRFAAYFVSSDSSMMSTKLLVRNFLAEHEDVTRGLTRSLMMQGVTDEAEILRRIDASLANIAKKLQNDRGGLQSQSKDSHDSNHDTHISDDTSTNNNPQQGESFMLPDPISLISARATPFEDDE